MTFFDEVTLVYRNAWAFIRKAGYLLLLFAFPLVTLEIFGLLPGAQNWQLWESQWTWVGFICLQIIVQVPIFYAMIRFLALGVTVSQALAVNKASIRTFWPFAAFMLVADAARVFAVSSTGQLLWEAAFPLLWLPLALWAVSAPGGGEVISPLRSLEQTFYELPWALLLTLVVGAPIGMLSIMLKITLLQLDDSGTFWPIISSGVRETFYFISLTIFYSSIFVIAQHCGLRIRRVDEPFEGRMDAR